MPTHSNVRNEWGTRQYQQVRDWESVPPSSPPAQVSVQKTDANLGHQALVRCGKATPISVRYDDASPCQYAISSRRSASRPISTSIRDRYWEILWIPDFSVGRSMERN